MKIWVDDLRSVPKGYKWARSVNQAVDLAKKAETNEEMIKLLDHYHDLGDYYADGVDAIKLLDWLAERGTFYPIRIHTANPVGRENMERMIARYWPV